MRIAKLAAAALMGLTASACTVDDSDRDLDGGPGQEPWMSDDIACSVHEDCAPGEYCDELGVCRMKRCDGVYDSMAPLGPNHYFGTDAEFTIISDNGFVDAFESANGGYMSSWEQAGGKVMDVTGGNLNGQRPHGIALAMEFSDVVRLRQSDGDSEMSVGIWPRALAVGDVDADGLDELVAFAEDGSIALCQVNAKTCAGATIDGALGTDVAVADIDGDGFAEPIFLFENQGSTQLVVWNTDAATTGQEESYGWVFDMGIKAISAGDIDGDRVAEILALEDGGWFGLANDKLHVFSPQAGNITSTVDVYGHSSDVAVGDRDSDEVAEVAILREDHQFELYRSVNGQLASMATWPITVGQEAQRISMLDWDGDSASGRLLGGPELISGYEVPVVVLVFPPYPRGAANAPLNASVMMGNTESTNETMSDTVSLSVGLAVSFGADFGSIAKAKVGTSLTQDVSVSHRVSLETTIGARYSVLAAPELHGTDYSAMLLSCGCYHKYAYEVEDPAGLIGGSGQVMDLFMPVGGQTLLLSTKRYNKMAESTPHLPVIPTPVRIGDVASYPPAPVRLDGSAVPAEDMLFPEIPSYQASDVGFVNFWLVVGESETNEVCEKTTIGISGSIGAAGVTIDGNLNVGVAQGYSLTVGTNAMFAGSIPPIPDDPATPEDEFAVHRYSFSPYVYREHYLTPEGEVSGYYVLSHTAAK